MTSNCLVCKNAGAQKSWVHYRKPHNKCIKKGKRRTRLPHSYCILLTRSVIFNQGAGVLTPSPPPTVPWTSGICSCYSAPSPHILSSILCCGQEEAGFFCSTGPPTTGAVERAMWAGCQSACSWSSHGIGSCACPPQVQTQGGEGGIYYTRNS